MMKDLVFILLFSSLLSFSCKKDSDTTVTNPLLEQYFASEVLNRNFTVSLAKDNGTDLTSKYNGYIFVLLKSDYYHGPLTATKGDTSYTGTWSSNNDYSKLVITLPESPAEFKFLSREWKFTSKDFPTMELAPWGSSENLILHMYRQ